MVGYLKDMQRLCLSALKDFLFFFLNNTKSMFQVLVHVHVVPYDPLYMIQTKYSPTMEEIKGN